jgi:threonine/homoserine/homoserine lactone efflux protein
MWIYWIQGIVYGFAAAVTPGPLAMYVLSQAVTRGWRRALPAAFSPLISDGPIAIIVLAVLSRIPPRMIVHLRLLGGAFLLYLAYGAWKDWRNFDAEKPVAVESGQRSALKAAVINWLNPNPYIAWSVILGPILLSGWRASPANGIAMLAGFYIVMIASMIGMIFMFAAAKRFGSRVQKILIILSSVALAAFGLYQIGDATLFSASKLLLPFHL